MSRQIWTIPGGVHPPENKLQSNQTPIQPGPIPTQIVLPLQQHIGAPSTPVVKVGDTVLKGQLVAEPNGLVSAPVHASTSGTVTAIEPRAVQHPSAIDGLCIVIEPDGRDQWIDHQGAEDYTRLEKSQVLDMIRNAGITGMGGAGFPSAVKLATRPDTVIEQLILNAVECEPYITADDMLMRERAAEIVAGLKIIQWLVSPQETLIGIEDNKPEAIKAMQAATADSDIEVVVIPTKYPSGGEKQLIQILTGKEVPSGGLPAQVGVICHNTGTAYAINRAVIHGEPLISRITTLTGDTVAQKGNYEVLLGTPVEEMLHFVATNIKKMQRLIMGGPMMGFAIHDLAVPIVKATNCLLAPARNELADPRTEQACIRCGSCEQVCPASLLPQQLYWFAKTQDFDKAQSHNLMDCIECGACAFVCPSNIPLVQYYRYAKGQVRNNEEQARKAEHARMRFESHQARLEKERLEKEAKRKARAEAAAKKAAAKKALAAKEGAATPRAGVVAKAADAKSDNLTALKSKAASASKRWKDAEKALQAAQANESDNLDALKKKVEQLKTKADSANQAFVEARKASRAGAAAGTATATQAEPAPSKSTPTPTASAKSTAKSTPAASTENDPLAPLKKASSEDFQAWQDAKKALEEADQNDTEKVAELTAKVAAAKAKSDASKKAMKEARARQREEIQQQKAAADPVATAKAAVETAEKKVQKFEKSLAVLVEKGADTSKIEPRLADAQDALAKAKAELENAEASAQANQRKENG